MEQKIKQDEIQIGANIRRLRLEKGIRQTDFVGRLAQYDVAMTREALVKIESGMQHIKATQLRAICKALETTYEELLKEN